MINLSRQENMRGNCSSCSVDLVNYCMTLGLCSLAEFKESRKSVIVQEYFISSELLFHDKIITKQTRRAEMRHSYGVAGLKWNILVEWGACCDIRSDRSPVDVSIQYNNTCVWAVYHFVAPCLSPLKLNELVYEGRTTTHDLSSLRLDLFWSFCGFAKLSCMSPL